MLRSWRGGRWIQILTGAVIVAMLAFGAGACGSEDGAAVEVSDVIVASTTSTRDSGLFDALLPAFAQSYPEYRVKVNAVGTGEALKLGEICDADVVLVHAPDAEKQFVADGFGTERREVMYNDFVIVGPVEDPAGIAGGADAVDAFAKIAAVEAPFITRGDDSGTNEAELKIWAAAGLEDPAGDWYRNIGQGMGSTLTVTHETSSYTLADRGTWLSMEGDLDGLQIVVEGDPALFNQYGIIPVDPENCPDINSSGANDFMKWMVGEDAQALIDAFGIEEYGQALFVANASE